MVLINYNDAGGITFKTLDDIIHCTTNLVIRFDPGKIIIVLVQCQVSLYNSGKFESFSVHKNILLIKMTQKIEIEAV